MSATKSKSALSGTPNAKAPPVTPRATKSSRGAARSDGEAASPLQSSRVSVDKSPRSVTSKPTVDRPSPRLSTPPDKKASRLLKPSELQAELNLAQEALKKTKEKLVLVEKEKMKAVDDLKQAQKSSEEVNEKLREALLAQKRAEENSEIEKFRALELEQTDIEAVSSKEVEWLNELKAVRNQHALDVAALLSATQELQKVKQELLMTCDAKNQALRHAEDATTIAEVHAEKVASLSAELVHLRAVLDFRVKMEADENEKLISELRLEVDSLKQEIEKAKKFEEKVEEKEAALEQLNVELEAAKMAEAYAHNLVVELHERIEELASQAEHVKRLEKSASESLESVTKQLELSKNSLHEAESEIAELKEKVGSLEILSGKQKWDLEESERRLVLARDEASGMVKKIEFLNLELKTLEEEKIEAINNEKLANANSQTLSEERDKLKIELEISRDEVEKAKRELENLASEVHEISSEARDAKENLLSVQVEIENYQTQIKDLKLALETEKEKHESMLDDAKQEIAALTNLIEQSNHDYDNLKAENEQKELQLMNSLKSSEEKYSSAEKEIDRLVNLLKLAEKEACATREEGDHWNKSFKEAESEVVYLKGVVDEANGNSMKLKEGLKDKEDELHKIRLENEELQKREAASLEKVKELSELLEEALAKKQEVENSTELTDSEKDYDMLPKVVQFSEQNGTGAVTPKVEAHVKEQKDTEENEMEIPNGKLKDTEEKTIDKEDPVEVDLKMWESCKIGEKELSPEQEESFGDEMDSKTEGGDGYNQENSRESLDSDGSLPLKQESQKKKKPLLRKFGSLLKKKGTTNQK